MRGHATRNVGVILVEVAVLALVAGGVAAEVDAGSMNGSEQLDKAALALPQMGAAIRALAGGEALASPSEASPNAVSRGEAAWRAAARELASELQVEGRLATLLAEPALAQVVKKELQGVRCTHDAPSAKMSTPSAMSPAIMSTPPLQPPSSDCGPQQQAAQLRVLQDAPTSAHPDNLTYKGCWSAGVPGNRDMVGGADAAANVIGTQPTS